MSRSKKREENEPKRELLKWSEEMDTVFIDAMSEQNVNGDKATGEGATSAKEKMFQWANEEDGNQIDDFSTFAPSNSSCELQLDEDSTSPVHATSKVNSEVEVEASSKSKKRKASGCLDKQFEIMNDGINNVVEAIREGNDIAAKGIVVLEKKGQPTYTEDKVYQELVRLDIPKGILLDALLFLVKNDKNCRAFFAVPTSLHKELLYKMMGCSNVS
ncbi:hypothetical protein CCACVL1_04536 [Corchorus capsularis]|uniref:Uncharacterized protein n=1 Tax=Corchorus capsularis TaxID=210143 RepID=A0A1R3JRR0_COCAP|nr:hypothetical protein CCACVL1_04536 [Corchorus capsularis]